jgi:hypothetical protein
MQVRLLRFAGVALLLVLAVILGALIQKFQLPPYEFISNTYKSIFKPEEEWYPENDIAALITIKDQEGAIQLRSDLIHLLWGEPGLPSTLPTDVTKNFGDKRFDDISSLSRIDKITAAMDFGLKSYCYHFVPKSPNNKVVLYHEGHSGDFSLGKKQIEEFLDNGYSVVAFSMLLTGGNSQPDVVLPGVGNFRLERHDHIKFLKPAQGHNIKYFIEPVVIVLNYLQKNYHYSSISMVGISGGGWATILAPAVDERIQKSFSVAGSYPLHLRLPLAPEWGDYEQNEPEIYQAVNYLDLYILGSYGTNRELLQIFNEYDSCCFSGTRSNKYKNIVKDRVNKLGSGKFDIFIDNTHMKHAISDAAMKRILDELGKNT